MSEAVAAIRDRRPMEGMKVYNLKLGMWIFLLSEIMFFTALIGAYVILRAAHPEHFARPGEVLNVPLTAINTFVLICSSVSMVMAYAAITHEDQRGLKLWLFVTMLLGSIFVGVQVYEYVELTGHGFVPMVDLYDAGGANLYGATFYAMTGFHGLHVSLGVFALGWCLWRAFQGRYSAENYGGIEIVGLYWHFVDLVWIVLFTIVYLI